MKSVSASLFSIKKPCQNLNRSCTKFVQVVDFGKMPRDVLAVPSKLLSPVGKLVFAAMAVESRGSLRTVVLSDGDLARCCGASRGAVISGRKQLEGLELIGKDGDPVEQVQPYKILHPMFAKAPRHGTKTMPMSSPETMPEQPQFRKKPMEICPKCNKLRVALKPSGWCRNCEAKKTTEDIARRVCREELSKIETA